MKQNKRLLITGCGRSGTKYISFLLRRLGMDVQHEKVGDDGVASWYMAVNASRSPFGDVRRHYKFEHIFHQVRYPLAVISSVQTFKEKSWHFICKHTDMQMYEPLLLRCAKYWYYWNIETEKIAHWRYRIEDFHVLFTNFCERLQIKADIRVLDQLSLEVNTRKYGRAYHFYEELCERLHLKMNSTIARLLCASAKQMGDETLTWEMLNEVDGDWSNRVMEKAREYGYTC